MATGNINSAITGIQVAQLGLLTTEHNIANAHTAGYTRQRTLQTNNLPMPTGSGYVGQGAHVTTIERMYDSFLSLQVNRAQTTSSELGAYYTEIKQIDNMLADENAGVSPALQSFFTGVQQVASNPSQLPGRQAMISSAQALVSRFQGLADRVSQLYDGVNSKVTAAVASINAYAQEIANLNEGIVIASSSIDQPPNDLMDQRDQLVLELNKLIKVTTTTNTDGTYNVYVGNGQLLVASAQAMSMTASPSVEDSARFVVGVKLGSTTQELPESLISGGSLGGLLSFRSGSLDRVANDLGRNAASLALTFNAQNALGQDLLGQSIGSVNFAADFFTVPQPTVLANSGNNAGAAGVISASLITHGRYDLALNGAGTLYTLTRPSDGTTWTGATLAALQSTVPTSEGLNLTSATVAAGASTQVFNQSANGVSIDGSYTLALNGAGSLYTLTRQSDGTAWTGATLAALQATLPLTEGLKLDGVPVPVVLAGASTQVFSPAASGANFYTKLTNSDYRLNFDSVSGNYRMTRLSDNVSWSNASLTGLSKTVADSEGFSFSLASGSFAAGDSFIIQPVRNAAGGISVNAKVAADSRLVAAAMPVRTATVNTNTGTGKISAGDSLLGFGAPTLPAAGVTLTFNSVGNSLTLAGLPAGANVSVSVGGTSTVYPGPTIPYTSGAKISFAGVSFDISGNLNNGDSFTLGKNASGVSDGRNALTLGKLQTQNTMSGRTASYQSAYAQLVSDAGNKSREIEVKSKAQDALLKQSTDSRDSLSGVNLDEEAANLMRYQQAYQASAKMLDLGNKLFDTLLSIM